MLVDRLFNQANAFVAITFQYSWNMFTTLLTRHANTIYNRHIDLTQYYVNTQLR